MEATSKCLLCGATAKLKTNIFLGYQNPDKFAIYHCKTCDTSFSMPRVDATVIYNLIYQNAANFPDGYGRYWRYKETVKTHSNSLQFLCETQDAQYWAVDTALKNIVTDKQNTKILEIGCGMGYLTYSLVKAGYNVIGLDISSEAIVEATNTFGNYYVCDDIYLYAQRHKEEYDVIIMTEVIEHIENPTKFIGQAVDMLGCRGRIIMTTPNKSIYPDNIIWKTDLPPIHCWWFSEKSMEFIAKQLNCVVKFVNFREYYAARKPVVEYLTQTYSAYKFRKNGELIRRPSFFDKLNYLFFCSNSIEKEKASFLGRFAYLFFDSKIYKRYKSYISPTFRYVCDEQGITMCVIYEK